MLPRVLAGRRWAVFVLLLLNGMAQAMLTVAASLMLARLLRDTASPLPLVFAAGLIASAIAVIWLRWHEFQHAEVLGQDYVTDVRMSVFTAMMQEPAGSRSHGIAMVRMTSDLNSLKNWISRGVARLTISTMLIFAGLAAMALVAPEMFVASAALVALTLVGGLILAVPLRANVRRARRYRGRLASRIGELLRARDLLVQFDAVGSERRRLRRLSRRMAASLERRRGLVGMTLSLPDLLVPLAALTWLWQVHPGANGADTLILVVVVFGFLTQALREALSAIDYAISFAESRRRLGPLLEVARRSRATMPTAKHPAAAGEALVMEADCLGLWRLKTPPGTNPELVIRMIAGIAGTDAHFGGTGPVAALARLNARERRACTKLVAHDLPLLRRSPKRNLTDFSRNISRDQMKAIRKLLDLDRGLPFSWTRKSKLGDLGSNLDGKIAARLMLARALLAQPRVLLVAHRELLDTVDGRQLLADVSDQLSLPVIAVIPESETQDWREWKPAVTFICDESERVIQFSTAS